MKKLIAIIFGSMLLFSTHAAAELAIGVTANFASIDTDGSETELTGDTEKTTASVSDDVVIPEVFVEAVNENGLAFGVSYIPARELGNKKRIDKNGDDAAENDDGDYTAKDYYVEALVGYAFNDIDTSRVITATSATATGEVAAWNATSKVLKLINLTGTFSSTSNIIGNTSGASFGISTFDNQAQPTDPTANNVGIETAADSVIDFSEGNPFSEGTNY